MPELPEVETVRRGLVDEVEGARIVEVEQRRPDLRHPMPENFVSRLTGRTVVTLGRRAKYLLFHLDDGTVLVSHLGMSGSYRIHKAQETDAKARAGREAFYIPRGKMAAHDHVVLTLARSNSEQQPHGSAETEPHVQLIYNDPRRFGFMDLVEDCQLESHPMFVNLGPEPTGNALSAEGTAAKLAGRQTPIKSALLDQSVIAGLGNIYVCEALWRAGVSPRRLAGSLVKQNGEPTNRLRNLISEIRAIIAEAIEAGGSTLRDHIQTDGSLGYFQFSFAAYDREGETCPKPQCGGKIKRIVQSGRSTFYCSRCQR